MTPEEELDFVQRHPVPRAAAAVLADLKRVRAIKEGAKRAAERGGMATFAILNPYRKSNPPR